jgi:NAD(P)-dependent dehydrogenase (short-subunit alcohol dehydrogenase family)
MIVSLSFCPCRPRAYEVLTAFLISSTNDFDLLQMPYILVKITDFPSKSRIDVLANIAGVADTLSSADTITDTEWDHVMAINLTVPVKMMRTVLAFMKQKKHHGAIVNVASRAGVSGAAAGIACTASKHGLVSDYCV